MMLCDAELFLSATSGWVTARGLATRRIELEWMGTVSVQATRDGRGGYFPVDNLDNFREGEEHPSVTALLGPLNGKSEEVPDGN